MKQSPGYSTARDQSEWKYMEEHMGHWGPGEEIRRLNVCLPRSRETVGEAIFEELMAHNSPKPVRNI